MANNVLELKKEFNSQMQEIQWISSRISKKVIPRPTTGKWQNNSKKQKEINKTTLEAAAKKREISFEYVTIRMTDGLSIVTMEARS